MSGEKEALQNFPLILQQEPRERGKSKNFYVNLCDLILLLDKRDDDDNTQTSSLCTLDIYFLSRMVFAKHTEPMALKKLLAEQYK